MNNHRYQLVTVHSDNSLSEGERGGQRPDGWKSQWTVPQSRGFGYGQPATERIHLQTKRPLSSIGVSHTSRRHHAPRKVRMITCICSFVLLTTFQILLK